MKPEKILYIIVTVTVLSLIFTVGNILRDYRNLKEDVEKELLPELPGKNRDRHHFPTDGKMVSVPISSGKLVEISTNTDASGMAKILPHYEATSGKFSGIKIDNIKKGSIIERAGLRNGDIIKVVNGQRLTSPQRAIQIFRKARCQSRIEVCLLRKNRVVKLSYNIRD